MKVLSRAESWTIGDLAGKVGVPTHVLRHWESLGLLEPQARCLGLPAVRARRPRPRRRDPAQQGRRHDPRADRGAPRQRRRRRHEVLTAHLKDIEDRMQALERSRAMTEHALACRAHDVAACPRFASTVADLVEGRLATLPRHDASGARSTTDRDDGRGPREVGGLRIAERRGPPRRLRSSGNRSASAKVRTGQPGGAAPAPPVGPATPAPEPTSPMRTDWLTC